MFNTRRAETRRTPGVRCFKVYEKERPENEETKDFSLYFISFLLSLPCKPSNKKTRHGYKRICSTTHTCIYTYIYFPPTSPKMKKSSLRRTLLSLLGLTRHISRAQTTASSWGTPFTVDAQSSSTDALIPSTHTQSSQTYTSFLPPPSSPLSNVPTGLAVDTTPPVVSRSSDVTLVSGTQSRSSQQTVSYTHL